jgi:tetratricopeptide (TPR) repeat protein
VDAFEFDDGAALDALLAGAAPAAPAPPVSAAALLAAGDGFHAQGLYGEALERYDAAAAADPSRRDAALGAARALVLLRRGAEARARLVPLLATAPDDGDLLGLAADAALAAGDAAGAVPLAEHATALAPSRADLWQRLGDARAAARAEGAAAAYRRAIVLDPDRAAARRALAGLLADAGLDAAAERQLVAALATVPTYAQAVLELAALRRRGGRAGEACAVLVDLLRHDPYDVVALVELGETLLAMDRPGDAGFAVTRALRFEPEHAGALYVQGLVHARQQRVRDALECWHHAIAADVRGDVAERARRAAVAAEERVAHELVA